MALYFNVTPLCFNPRVLYAISPWTIPRNPFPKASDGHGAHGRFLAWIYRRFMSNVLVILAPGFEEVEALTAVDVLRRANIPVQTCALGDNAVVPGSHRISVVADRSWSEIGDPDVLVLPGGLRGVENMLQSDALLHLVSQMDRRGALMAAICAAPLVFDRLGLLSGRRFTCHPCVYDRLTTPALPDPAVTDDRFITGRSAGCALPWSLALVRRILGELPSTLEAGLAMPF